jgi:scaffold protein (connect acetoacetyl-CoA thiolase and HMG-CoA synthase)
MEETAIKTRIPIANGFFSMPDSPGGPRLLANKCPKCREIYFPKEKVCLRCGNHELEDVPLSKEGKLHSFTVIRQQPPIYKGPVPYAIGIIEFPENVRTTCLISECNFSILKIGMSMELVVERLHDDEQGNEVVCHKFKPIV